jgi:hypothetical protein
MTVAKAFEEKLNVLIGLILSEELGVDSFSEDIRRGGRTDVVVFYNGTKIAIEGSYERADAERDAKRRIEDESAEIAPLIEVNYKPFRRCCFKRISMFSLFVDKAR